MTTGTLFLSLALAAGFAGPALAEVRALLVGVADYHRLDADLKGPRNDVRLMAETLIARGADPARIAVLTTPGAALPFGVSPPADPTRAAILAALAALAQAARPGDTVVFYFSGHGSQAPDASGDEAGGYDEILLPSDAAGWKGQFGAVENALVDDELQVAMQAILDSGTELVAILDACFSATGFRAVGGAGVARYVAPETLGIPGGAEPADGGEISAPLVGRYAFLYSSQSDERSFEYPLGDPADAANWYGDFTRGLAAVLTEVPDLTWAQALAASAEVLRQEQASQTPDGEGTALDAAVFGASAPAERYRVEDGVLRAGLLDGLSEGATVALYDRAAGGEPLATASLAALSPTEARLTGAPPLPATAWAEVTAPGVPAPVVLGRPDDPLLRAIESAAPIDGVTWSDSGFDLGLVLDGDRLAVTGRDGVLDPDGPGSSPRIALAEGEERVAGFLDRAVQAFRLQAALARAAGRKGLTLPGAGLKVTAERLPAGPDCVAGPALPLKDGTEVAHCDEVWLALRNGSSTAQDVTVLYLDRELRLTPIWPPQGQSNRIAFGETADVGLRIENPDGATGVEEIIVIAVPARDGAPRTVLTALASPGATRSAGVGSATEAWLTAAAMPDGTTRGAGPSGKTEQIKVTRLRVRLAATAG